MLTQDMCDLIGLLIVGIPLTIYLFCKYVRSEDINKIKEKLKDCLRNKSAQVEDDGWSNY